MSYVMWIEDELADHLRMHVFPLFGKVHYTHDCWCDPQKEYDTNEGEIWMHNPEN